ncbi:unnamed protein product [Trichobilharzia regenti]|nr:unnamed protein product [Trichobilharzia regenti]
MSMSRFELSNTHPNYNEGNFCDDMMEQVTFSLSYKECTF